MPVLRSVTKRSGWARLIRRLAVPASVAVVLAVTVQPVQAGTSGPKATVGHVVNAKAVARARAESAALAAKSRLSTAQLIRAARLAGSRLRVHYRAPAPRDIAVHAPIVVTRRLLASGSPGAQPQTTTPLSGLVTSPVNEGQTSTNFSLQAQLTGGCGTPCSATTYHGVTFQYRVGTSGTFASIPAAAVTNAGAAITWPVTTIELSSGQGVASPNLTWQVTKTLAASGLLQIQAEFSDGLGDFYTTSPVTVTLNATGTGSDFAVALVGPAMVGLQSGDMSLSATDVSISGYGMGLSVSRTFNSLTPATPSVFGPGWTSSLPVSDSTMSWASVTDDSSYAVLTGADGSVLTFAAGTPAGGITPYTAQGAALAQGLVLTKSSTGFTLADPSGDQAKFTAANSNTPSYYTPAVVTRPGTSRSVGYIFDATKADASYGDPLLMVGPNANLAQGVSSTSACPNPPSATTWADGCRALQFSYSTAGVLTQISFVYQQSGVLTTVPVAAYSYDASGRLTGEWDPRFTPNQVIGYSYDETKTDANYGRMLSYSPAQSTAGSLAAWNFSYDTTAGTTDFGKLSSVSRTHSGSGGTATQTIDYEVPLTTAAGGPVNMDPTTVGTWNQTDVPASAVAIFPATHVPASPPTSADWPYAQISYYDANALEVNTAGSQAGTWNITTTQYDAYGDMIAELTAADRAEALAAGSSSASVAAELETVSDYTTSADGSELLDHSYGPLHTASVAGMGIEQIRNEMHYVYDQGAPAGGPFDLVTTQTGSANIGAATGGTTADTRTTDYAYNVGTDDTGWTLRSPMQTIIGPDGLLITSTTIYNESPTLYGGEPLVIATCLPSDTACAGAGTEQYIFYTGGVNSLNAACGDHAMWADLVCVTQPVAQPGTAGLPSLPVTTYTYNIYQQLLTTTATIGSSTRTTTYNYDAVRRPLSTTVVTTGAGMGTAVQEMVDNYYSTTGQLHTQETENSGGTVTAEITYAYDDFGQLKTYTDASGNATGYTYNLDGTIASVNDGKGTTSYTYGTNELPVTEVDSQAGTFTAAYNPDENLAAETYPGGLTGTYGYDETGTATSLSYAGAAWTSPLQESVVPDTHGNSITQSISDSGLSLASSQVLAYDKDNRLTSVQDTEAGQCTTRTYTYNANSDRTSLATAAPGTGGVCQTTGPTTENYSYDSGDRLINAGYAYDTQGDITTTPSVDAGGTGILTSTYYATDMLASQTQNGQAITWQLDPTENRFASWVAAGVTYTNHFSGTGNAAAWTSASTGTWTRSVTGPNGLLAASVTAAGTTLELANLHGDIVATATTSPTATGPAATYLYKEFGTAEAGAPGSYGWLGADQIPAAGNGSDLLMGVRAYNSADGRFNQVDPIAGGSANAYDYAFQNPADDFDLSGQHGWRCYGFTCGYEWDKFGTDEIEWAIFFGAPAAACLWVTEIVGGFICGVLFGVLSYFKIHPPGWPSRCLYVGFGYPALVVKLISSGC